MTYNWQQPDWPDFTYQLNDIEQIIMSIAEEMGYVSGVLNSLPANVQSDALIDIMVSEAIKTSAIEGEFLSRPDVMSSIKNNLGVTENKLHVKDKQAKGIGELMVLVRQTFQDTLTEETLFHWHHLLMGYSSKINSGVWRKHTEDMQIVSGPIGNEKIHFIAPPSLRVPKEMKAFIKWFNDTAPGGKKEIKTPAVRSAVAHLYFESIHPFEDGNGRIGRAIAEKALAQSIGRPILLSLSQIIEANKKEYYSALQEGSKNNEITNWIRYFVTVIYHAQQYARNLIDFTLKKIQFMDRIKEQINERQKKVLLRMLESHQGFEGGMTAKKYISITSTSKATATRDLQELTHIGALSTEGSGRNVRYRINWLT